MNGILLLLKLRKQYCSVFGGGGWKKKKKRKRDIWGEKGFENGGP